MTSNIITKWSGSELSLDVSGKNRKTKRDVQLVFAFCFLISLVSAWHNLMMPFLAPPQNYYCQWADDTPIIDRRFLLDAEQLAENSNSSNPDERCYRHYQNETISCDRWFFDQSFYHRTIWKLVCAREWLVSLGQSIFMAGYVCAMVVFGPLSDHYGRRPTIWIAFGVFLSSGLLCLTANGYATFTAFRFFVSMGVTGAVMELVEPKARSRYGIGIQFGWSLGFVLIPGLSWLVRDWFYSQLATTVPAIGLIIFWWYVPESPRWSRNVATIYGPDETDLSVTLKNRPSRATFFDLFRTPNMRKKSIVLFVCWFVNSFIYFGLSLGAGDLGGNPFLSFFIAGAIEFPAHVVATRLVRIIGRRIPLSVALIVGGLACLLTIPSMTSETLRWLRIFLAMTGKFFLTASFSILYVISAELFPTVVRTTGVGSCSLCARIASTIAPFVKELSNITHPSVPFAVFGCMSIFSGFTVLLLPETKLTNLPDTINEGEDVG